ncbi:MAG TPA: undecaprenyl diphosphate synthase family protein [Methanoregulaceae archaeon]|nr:undecaprenyl diphosphate synthase family protein [Methanoregulaceae archaeon]HPD75460.1 undecaprenyl diphosphate synthase family protein [Methanoregulaceae archaeon]HRY75010.1 undecaprenyl diphosphate synthase family protein [Methanoregulaceae archaeon]
MIYRLYEQLLRRQITMLPAHICFMISGRDMADAPDNLLAVTRWCTEISAEVTKKNPSGENAIRGLTFHISTPVPDGMERCMPAIRAIGTIARLDLHYHDAVEQAGSGLPVVVAIGKSGREEITACIRKMAQDNVAPETVDENLLESYLTFKYAPDIVVKSGGDHLTDFLIWQSVYSEIFFSDVNWRYFRNVDFLRILRDYQSRVRRFGT